MLPTNSNNSTIRVRIAQVEILSPAIKRFTLVAEQGILPSFTSGSHVIVTMSDGDRRWHNAYSLLGSPDDSSHYQIAVLKEAASRGGSVYMHEHATVGTVLEITTPKNLFPLSTEAGLHVLIAGGIGITPLLSHKSVLEKHGLEWQMHYAYRSVGHAAFLPELASAVEAAHVHTYDASANKRFDAERLLASLPRSAHLYVCGPQSLIDTVQNVARTLHWPETAVHSERFSTAPNTGGAFTIVLQKSNKRIEVAEHQTILHAIQEAGGTHVESLCCEGVCGTCELAIVEGKADHRDQYFTDAEKAAQKSVLICVSRSLTPCLVLDA